MLNIANSQVGTTYGVSSSLTGAGNTGYAGYFSNTSTAGWALNATGTFLCIREYVRRRRAVPVPNGRIVTFSSLAGQAPGSPTGVAYAAAKAAVINLMETVAQEYGPYGIRANAVTPGPPATKMLLANVGRQPDKVAELVRSYDLQRLSDPEEVAGTVLWLASDESSFVTGANFVIDGGQTAI